MLLFERRGWTGWVGDTFDVASRRLEDEVSLQPRNLECQFAVYSQTPPARALSNTNCHNVGSIPCLLLTNERHTTTQSGDEVWPGLKAGQSQPPPSQPNLNLAPSLGGCCSNLSAEAPARVYDIDDRCRGTASGVCEVVYIEWLVAGVVGRLVVVDFPSLLLGLLP